MTNKRPLSTWADWVQVIIQGIVLLGAFFALSIYKGQLIEMRAANKLMKASTDAATRAAKAAEDGIRKAEASSHLDQRAWVSTTGVGETHDVGQPVVTTVITKNSGRTFAKEVIVESHRRGLPRGVEPDLSLKSDTKDGSRGLMAPDTEYPSETVGVGLVGENDLQLVKKGDIRVFVFGTITYSDVFGCEHWTKFCWVLNPSHPDRAHWAYSAYKIGNDADSKECP
jgi:hypothetical protein